MDDNRTVIAAVTSRAVFSIALPMTLAFLTTPLIGTVDTAVIGQYGEASLIGGLAVAALIFDVLFSTFNFLRTGTTGLTAQALGAGRRQDMAVTLLRALLLAAASGLLILALMAPIRDAALAFLDPGPAVAAAAVRYYDIRVLAAPLTLANYALLGWVLGLGRSGVGLALQTLLNGVNIALSLILGLELGYGVEGIAWAAVIAEATAVIAGLLVALRLGRGTFRAVLPQVMDAKAFGRMIGVNRDIMIRSFALLIAFAVFTRMGARFGDTVLAANAILMNFFMIGGYFLDGLAAAAEQLAGRAIGARQRDAFFSAVRLTVIWGFAFAGVASAILWFFGDGLVALMTTAVDVRAVAATFLPWAALTPLAGVLAFQMDGVYIGATWSRDMRNMMLLSLVAFLALVFALVPVLGNHGLWLALLLFLGARGATLSWRLPRLAVTAFP